MTTALYRRYRPDTFADMIGQEHVTGPLMQALRSGRVNHAYLFSGPRGCGKTTSARILARTLNCHRNTPETPLDTPCGECESCTELARGGSGSLDVVEIDAASHNGVDDARDLRERATFAPARDRYKIFILDEAHMVTPQGFNALLKIVEEPPPHIKFVFATTEPDKVIGTIRSRTHHYPFRLVPPDVLSPYLEKLSDAEGITIGSGVLPLVTRAGGGSVRDSLSVMDQLIAGASGGEVGYDLAVGLLGYTHASLLDDVVDALAVRDGASIFRVVDQIIATGHEPRRFVEDVLERLRDLIVIGVSGDAADAVLRDLPADQLERMRTQAGRLGVAELSRAADLVNAALTEMTGATSPRLHLELLCARLLLPGADDGAAGLAARIDRLERGGITVRTTGGPGTEAAPTEPAPAGDVGGGLTGAAAARAVIEANRAKKGAPAGSSTSSDASQASTEPSASAAASDTGKRVEARPDGRASGQDADEQSMGEQPAAGPGGAVPGRVEPIAARSQQAVEEDHAIEPAPVPEPGSTEAAEATATTTERGTATTGAGPMATEEVRRRWPEVLETLSAARVTWSLVGQNAQVASLDGGVLKLAFRADGLARAFANPRHTSAVEDAVYQTLGIQVKVEGIVGDGPGPADGAGPSGSAGPSGQGGPGGRPGPGSGSGGPGGTPAPGSDSPDGSRESGAARSQPSGRANVGPEGSPRSASTGVGSTAMSEPAETDGWPDVPVPGGRPGTADAGAGPVPPTAGPRDTAGNNGRGPAGSQHAGDEGSSGSDGAVDVWDTTEIQARARSGGMAVSGGPGANGSMASGGSPDGGRAGSTDGGPRGTSAVAVAERTATTDANPAAHADDPIPEPPPDYDDDLEPSGSRAPTPPAAPAPAPAPETVYATQPATGRLTGAERAREALRRAQAARGPAAVPGSREAPGVPNGIGASYDELSADDPDLEAAGSGLVGVPLVVKILGGTVIDERLDQA
ncbi:DNA polymerase III subunit gamma and tau [Myceligenerans salitolerans]|uniref:DNA-directed DNA polymerase n=1 Tax=Myceligenerans salitolerans TaxID=1230528 RepID=A0ABS3IDJ8_9MICO|nr:DNA polymerase III subunit gamma and tau [Myceligenerans salitolerans]MBO0611058.1 DNA polymerase III subunit gamma and tau [Myceligenerans salitolerans]